MLASDGLPVIGRTARGWLVLLAIAAPAALTGGTALVGLLSAETDAPCGKFCSGSSPDASTEAWMIAFAYVTVMATLCLCRVIAATDVAPATMPEYRGSLVFLAAASILLAIVTPGSWEPLRPALIVGGLSCLLFLIAAGRLATLMESLQQGRDPGLRREGPDDGDCGPIEA